MKQGHLATATFWLGLVILFGWQANAQIPRPPMPIPNVPAPPPAPKVVALMPPTAPLLRSQPTPIPPPAPAAIPIPPERLAPIPAMMPILPQVALPPTEFDRPYAGKLTVLKEDNYLFIRHVCRDTPNAVACSYRTYDSVSGETLSCLIMLGPVAHNDARVMQHELGHCTGWSNDHERARYTD
jgi:hypothetical protein